MILICQAVIMSMDSKLDDPDWFWFWELVSWTAFVLWLRFLIMLRCIQILSPVITMVFLSFRKMVPYLIIVVMGVMCFTNVFLAVRQIVYIRLEGVDGAPEPAADRTKEVTDFWSFKEKWLDEYLVIWQEVFVGAVIGLEGENAMGFTDTQWIIFLTAIIFNTVVLMNLLLAIVGTIQGEIYSEED